MAAKRTPFKDLRIEQFRSFTACAKAGNLARAAAELGLSRPALWQQLKALERRFDADFFSARRHGVELTEDGRLFRELAEPLLAEFDALGRIFDERRGRRAESLRVACPDSIEQNELAPVIAGFHRRHPKVMLHFAEVPSAEVAGLVLSGAVQLGIEADPPEVTDGRLEYEPLFRRRTYIVVPRRHPLTRKRRLAPADLAAHPFVMEPPFSRLRQHLGRAFAAAGLLEKWQIVLETTNERFLLETVARRLAISAVTSRAPVRPHAALQLLPADHIFGGFPVHLVRRRRHEGAAARLFCEALREAFPLSG